MRPPHRDPLLLAVILVGGTLGTLTRALLENAVPATTGSWPWATFGINVTGAFVLGALLEVLGRLGPDHGWRRLVRLGAGTGFLGGYTTYSTFAVEVVQLGLSGAAAVSVGYALASLVLGPAAAAAGYRLARLA